MKKDVKVMNELLKILNEVKPNIDFEKEKNIIDDEIIGSFDIITIIAMINEKFNIEFPVEELTPENFQTVEILYNTIKRIQKQ